MAVEWEAAGAEGLVGRAEVARPVYADAGVEGHPEQIPQTDENAHLTRAAWLQLIQGDPAESVKLYRRALDDLRRTCGSTVCLMSVAGIFYIYALLRNNANNALGEAHYESSLAMCSRQFSPSCRLLYEYTGHVLRASDEFFQNPCGDTADALERFNAAIVSFWLYNGQTDETLERSVDDLLARAESVGLQWIVSELWELKRRLDPDWMPTETPESAPRVAVPLVDCVRILPSWSVNINAVKDLIGEYSGMHATRAAWMVSLSPENPTEVRLELFEQHVTKKHHWTKGRRIHLDKLKRDVMAQGHWPLSFTARDVQVASILLQREDGQLWKIGTAQNLEEMTPNDALLLLKDSPLLYWADGTAQEPVRVVLDEPYVTIHRDEESHRVTLAVFPDIKPDQMLSAVRFDDNTLHLFQFSQIHKRIYNEIHGELTIPDGNFVVQKGDVAAALIPTAEVPDFFRQIGFRTNNVRNIMIIGGGKIAYYLAKSLLRLNVSVTIIERNAAIAEKLSLQFPKANIIHGDGTNRSLLLEEGLTHMDALCSLTGIDEENIVLSLFAKNVAPQVKTVTKVNRTAFQEVIRAIDVGSVIYPKYTTASLILQYVRANSNRAGNGSDMQKLTRILNNRAEAIEFTVADGSRVIGKTLTDIELKKGVLVGSIIRDGKAFIPRGSDKIQAGDSVIVITIAQRLTEIDDILKD